MRKMRKFIILFIVIIGALYLILENETVQEEVSGCLKNLKEHQIPLQLKDYRMKPEDLREGNLYHWMYRTSNELLDIFGEPERIDPSAYGYSWWIYKDEHQYIQYGVNEKGKVETIFAKGVPLPLEEVEDFRSYDQLDESLTFKREISFTSGLSSYTFYLSKEDIEKRPLIQVTDDIFVNLYFDSFTNELSSYRFLNRDVLLKHIPYELQYRGTLPNNSELSQKELDEIERGMEQQIFDLTNFIRKEHGLLPLQWNESLHEVASYHSQDMKEQDYFSHYDPKGNGLKERLAKQNVTYQYAGENIAAQYIDGLAAVEGWLNSKGHREAILDEKFTELGVGVYRFYYTQNFIGNGK